VFVCVFVCVCVCVFEGNPLEAHSQEQSYHPTQPFKEEKYKAKWKM